MSITDILTPYVTRLPTPQRILLNKVRSENPLRRIGIGRGVADIWRNEMTGARVSVDIWSYKPRPGASQSPQLLAIEVERDQQVQIEWINEVPDTAGDTIPVTAVMAPEGASPPPQNVMGIPKGSLPTHGADGRGFFVTHLHGGRTEPPSDGWAETLIAPYNPDPKKRKIPYNSHRDSYSNGQEAALLWFHDHAMHTTRLNVYAGLAGFYVVRDREKELALRLPSNTYRTVNGAAELFGPEYEKLLVIQDRNLDNAPTKTPEPGKPHHARLLHKVQDGVVEFFGPLTLVNGALWPVDDVEPCVHRLRILNGSNARTYRLHFCKRTGDDEYTPLDPKDLPVKQIGVDLGLLDKGVDLPQDGLTLSPAERADLLVDFAALADQEIYIINDAGAPFPAGDPLSVPIRGTAPDPDNDPDFRPYRHVMAFRIAPYASARAPVDMKGMLDRIAATGPARKATWARAADAVKERTIAIVERSTPNGPILATSELRTASEIPSYLPALQAPKAIVLDGQTYYVTTERFQDPVSFHPVYGTTEIWRYVNLTGDTHPMHMHLVDFLPVKRKALNIAYDGPIIPPFDGEDEPLNMTLSWDAQFTPENVASNMKFLPLKLTTGADLDIGPDGFDANEHGPKDTIRVNPGESVSVTMRFEGFLGRYLYHCHILEHEDHDMMRQFVVSRNDLIPMHGGEGGSISVGPRPGGSTDIAGGGSDHGSGGKHRG